MIDKESLASVFPEFVTELESYQKTSEEFFSKTLLDMINHHFGFCNTVITAYNEAKFLGGTARPPVVGIMERYCNGFYKRDVLARYISINRNEVLQKASPIVKIMDVIPEDKYKESEFLDHIGRAGFYYAAVLVFKDYRIVVFKSLKEGDFTAAEEKLLSRLYSIIASKYSTYLAYSNAKITNSEQSRLLDNLEVGFMMFDDNKILMECNQCALYYTSILFNKKNAANIFSDIMALFEKRGLLKNNSASTLHNGYIISLRCVSRLNSFNQLKNHYCISITQSKNEIAVSSESQGIFRCMTPRELEILDVFCSGLDYSGISDKLCISENTVRTHIKNIYRKLNISNQRTLVRLYSEYAMLHGQGTGSAAFK